MKIILFEIYEGAGNYILVFVVIVYFDAGNNDDIENYWKDSHIEAVEKFVSNNSQK